VFIERRESEKVWNANEAIKAEMCEIMVWLALLLELHVQSGLCEAPFHFGANKCYRGPAVSGKRPTDSKTASAKLEQGWEATNPKAHSDKALLRDVRSALKVIRKNY